MSFTHCSCDFCYFFLVCFEMATHPELVCMARLFLREVSVDFSCVFAIYGEGASHLEVVGSALAKSLRRVRNFGISSCFFFTFHVERARHAVSLRAVSALSRIQSIDMSFLFVLHVKRGSHPVIVCASNRCMSTCLHKLAFDFSLLFAVNSQGCSHLVRVSAECPAASTLLLKLAFDFSFLFILHADRSHHMESVFHSPFHDLGCHRIQFRIFVVVNLKIQPSFVSFVHAAQTSEHLLLITIQRTHGSFIMRITVVMKLTEESQKRGVISSHSEHHVKLFLEASLRVLVLTSH
mmetsp:Transcript_81740/g.155190  ORF Transcript_81740/g.155190 Transcript_81740/m.155190 type:complete len:293 (+) Transcript_81740:919-1797(+)